MQEKKKERENIKHAQAIRQIIGWKSIKGYIG